MSTFLRSLLDYSPLNLLPLTPPTYASALSIYHALCITLPIQLSTAFYPTGKTSLPTLPLNLPGKPAWILMELVSPLLTTLSIFSLHPRSGPSVNLLTDLTTSLGSPQARLIALCYYTHYTYRALISPLLNPSMAPMNITILLVGLIFNAFNGTMLGSYFAGIDGTIHNAPSTPRVLLGLTIWATGFAGNIYHESILRAIRTSSPKLPTPKQKADMSKEKDTVVVDGRVYKIPQCGLFDYVLHAHYFSEWVEWTGLWIATGSGWRNPVLLFVMFEVATMLPRAVQGRRWYVEKFGRAVVGGRKAVVPFLV
ncbi:hypothetical protein BJ508DRAFT_412295 [Ascobolus immersus RN42]|uniref:3-oxo-5-alpha-steroid 4-dehydrogenase C-terminal domain-containing protein n=1 Tax=Ascobolus immersus RN42 TaxID=1160509 RepID=A0A3N4IM16_ASCIM|nr:hypothetical protein BJ508DRAFT_412295 [Ascobolus immersus RN42]